MEKKIKSKQEFLDAIKREKDRRAAVEKAEQKKLADLEIKKKKDEAAARFKKMSGGIPNLKG